MSNPKATWAFMNPSKGMLRLYSDKIPDSASNLWFTPNVLLQKFPAEEFMATTKFALKPSPKLQNEKAGLVVMVFSYAYLGLKSMGMEFTLCMESVQALTRVRLKLKT